MRGPVVVLLLAGLVLAAPARAQAPAPVPAKPQTASLDTDAPPGAPPHWLPNERWVWQHWLPFDERRLYHLLGIRRTDVWQWLRDDTRTLAGLAQAHGWQPEALAAALVEPWRETLRRPRRLEVLRERALRVLTQGHLSQHLLFHSLHQLAIPNRAPAIFGVASPQQFSALRRAEVSPVEICHLNGITGTEAERRARAALQSMADLGVARQAIPPVQARRLLRRQLSQLPRWLRQSRYNGPPPLANPRASAATAANFSNNAALDARGDTVVYERYEAAVALAKSRGEINVIARPLARAVEPLLVSAPLEGAGRDPRSSYAPAVSRDGHVVAYESAQGNLNFAKRYGKMTVFVRDLRRATALPVSPGALQAGLSRTSYAPTISGDGRRVAFESYVTEHSANGDVELWLADVGRDVRWRRLAIGLADLGTPRLSGDGRFLVFTGRHRAEAFSRVWRLDLRGHELAAVSDGRGDAFEPEVSGDGRFVAYTQLAGGRTLVLRRDLRRPAARVLAPVPGDGLLAGARAGEPSISDDGRTVAFTARDAEGPGAGVFVRRGGRTELVSRGSGASAPPAAGVAEHPSVSGDGRRVAFTSDAWNLDPGKCDAARGVFVRDLDRHATVLASSGDGENRFLGATRGSSAPGDMTVELICA